MTNFLCWNFEGRKNFFRGVVGKENVTIWGGFTRRHQENCWKFTKTVILLGLAGYELIIGTFRSDYDYEYEYEFFNVYPVRMPDCVRLSRQLVLSSKSRRRLDTNYEIFNKSRPPTTSSLQVQSRVKRLVFKRADTLWNVPCNLSRNVLATLWHLVLFVY